MFKKLGILLVVVIAFSSCFEVVEEISLKKDGSGSFVYIVNMSQSKAEINTALKLDSFMGKKLPSISEIKTKIAAARTYMSTADGISNLVVTENYTDYIVTVKGNFTDIEKFNTAIKKCATQLGAGKEAIESDFNYKGTDTTYSREVAALDAGVAGKLINLLSGKSNLASYTCVVKTEGKVSKVDNPKAKISPSGKNVLLKLTASEILKNSAVMNLKMEYKSL